MESYNINNQLSKLPFWEKLTDTEKESVKSFAYIRHYPKDSVLYSCDDSCLGMINVLWGTIRVFILSEEGREITLYRLGKDDICILSASCVISQITFNTEITVEKDCDLLIINSGVFAELTENNIYARCFMFELATKRFSSVMWTMQQILFAGLDKRLASYLLSESEKNGSNIIKTTQEDIAKQINSAREAVARMLKRFVAEGYLTMSRGCIQLTNIGKMRKNII